MTTPKKRENIEKQTESITNYEALKMTVEQLRESGRLDLIDSARVRIALGLASAVDSMPDNPTLWREYRAAEKALREETEAHGDPFEQLIASLSAEVGNETKQKTKNARA